MSVFGDLIAPALQPYKMPPLLMWQDTASNADVGSWTLTKGDPHNVDEHSPPAGTCATFSDGTATRNTGGYNIVCANIPFPTKLGEHRVTVRLKCGVTRANHQNNVAIGLCTGFAEVSKYDGGAGIDENDDNEENRPTPWIGNGPGGWAFSNLGDAAHAQTWVGGEHRKHYQFHPADSEIVVILDVAKGEPPMDGQDESANYIRSVSFEIEKGGFTDSRKLRENVYTDLPEQLYLAAALQGNGAEAEILSSQTSEPKQTKEELNEALREAARAGDAEAVVRCLRDGADPNAAGGGGMTALYCAAMNNQVGCMGVLGVRGGGRSR
jgi:hypothetical protein